MAHTVTVARVRVPRSNTAGARVLVDRLWPRGVSHDVADLDLWLKEAGPSDGVRKAYGHDPARFPAFREAYEAELRSGPQKDALQELRRLAAEGPLCLLTATHEGVPCQADVLADLLKDV